MAFVLDYGCVSHRAQNVDVDHRAGFFLQVLETSPHRGGSAEILYL